MKMMQGTRSGGRWNGVKIVAQVGIFVMWMYCMVLYWSVHKEGEELARKYEARVAKETRLQVELNKVVKEVEEVKEAGRKKDEEIVELKKKIEMGKEGVAELKTRIDEVGKKTTDFAGSVGAINVKLMQLEMGQVDIVKTQMKLLTPATHAPSPPMATPKPTLPPTPPPGLSDLCKRKVESLLSSHEEWFFVTAESNKQNPATVLDVAAGTASLWIGMKSAAGNCFRFSTNSVDIDPYIEAHRLKNYPSTHDCDKILKAQLLSHFGAPTDPHSDVWHIMTHSHHITSGLAAGMVLHVSLRPRKEFSTTKPLTIQFQLPSVCLKPVPTDYPNLIKNVTLTFKPPAEPVIKLSGDLQEGLHDGVLADGGRAGAFVVSHGYSWNWKKPDFTADVENLLSRAFGTVDEGHTDAIIKGWDEKTVNFVLGPRQISRNMCGLKVLRFPDASKEMLLGPNGERSEIDIPIPEEVTIEDVITPYIELESAAVPYVEMETFTSGGLEILLKLHAGVFLISTTPDVIIAAVQRQLKYSYGTPETPDTVQILSSTSLKVTLSKRTEVPIWAANLTNTVTHKVVRLSIPNEVLIQPKANCSCACYHPDSPMCSYTKYEGDEIFAFPSLVVKLKKRLQVKWAVIGAGPSGMNGLGRLLDLWKGQEHELMWIDERGFKVGRLEGYHDVQSMNPCSDFLAFMNDYEYYKAFPLGESKKPLMAYEGNKKHCRLGFLSEPLLKATHIIRSRLVSVHGRVTDLHKVHFPNSTFAKDSTDFIWSLRVGDRDPVWVTDGIVLAIGADHHSVNFTFKPPTEIPFTTALNPGMLRAFINNDTSANHLPKGNKTVAVFGAGPSGVVALHNLALLPEVERVIHIPKANRNNDYTQLQTARPNGEYLNITRVMYDANTIKHLMSKVDYQIQCIGWRFPTFPYNGSVMVTGSGSNIYSHPKLFNVGVKHSPNAAKAQLFFISSLRTMSRASTQCKTPQAVECLTRNYGPIPSNLVDPNADARGGYVAT
eukprot:TRINITY_DN5991_c1_g1_i1.p1 TRINITY_DN5991_c1_g1~~TRINITY_DN5991_c1_g1_i1.p1  ORF type:complete len:1001 (+),score=195.61 TRINITY_DN5991_c1_g1_i1:82-3084(+)